ncbi:hypothetical protein EUGRSUZ_A00641 [Eucalyptus grandis]|uniref:Uncharacterized protein n=2 Tax=Eucalyptus grandis TaxID=71139 RepID=A0ACC3M0T4_EUCGR|nr:hypothetical protein EUGRSUZ_A00641 [Eucalyptus grandis]
MCTHTPTPNFHSKPPDCTRNSSSYGKQKPRQRPVEAVPHLTLPKCLVCPHHLPPRQRHLSHGEPRVEVLPELRDHPVLQRPHMDPIRLRPFPPLSDHITIAYSCYTSWMEWKSRVVRLPGEDAHHVLATWWPVEPPFEIAG